MPLKTHVLEVWGDFACFTRPELKAERLSYVCPPPSAARGILDAIYSKPPQFRWQVTRIEILKPPSFIALRRNEVKEKVNVNAVVQWINGSAAPVPLWADADRDLAGTDERGRTQRQTMALRDVRYRLHAQIRAWPGASGSADSLDAQFQRRASTGKCFHQPYFGCREFPAFFRLVGDGERLEPPVSLDLDLGLMVYDVFDLSRVGTNIMQPAISLFEARIRRGVLDVPPYESDAVFKTMTGVA